MATSRDSANQQQQQQDDSEDEIFFGAGTEKELLKAARYRRRRTEYYCPDFRLNRQSLLPQSNSSSNSRNSFRPNDANIVSESQDDADDEEIDESEKQYTPADNQFEADPTAEVIFEDERPQNETTCLSASFASTASSGGCINDESYFCVESNCIEDSMIVHQRRSQLAGATSRGSSGSSKLSPKDDVRVVRESSMYVSADDHANSAARDSGASSADGSYLTADSGRLASDVRGIHRVSAHYVADSPSVGNQTSEVADKSTSSLAVLSVSEVVHCLESDSENVSRNSFPDMSGLSLLPLDSSSDRASLHYLSEFRLSVNKSQLGGTEVSTNQDDKHHANNKKVGDYIPIIVEQVERDNHSSPAGKVSITNDSARSIDSLEEAQIADLAKLGQRAWLEQAEGRPTEAVATATMATLERERLTGTASPRIPFESQFTAKRGLALFSTAAAHVDTVTDLSIAESVSSEESLSMDSVDVAAATMATLRRERSVTPRNETPVKMGGRFTAGVSTPVIDISCVSLDGTPDHSSMASDSLESSSSDGSTLSSLDVAAATLATLAKERLYGSPAGNITGGSSRTTESFRTARSETTSQSWQTAKSGKTSLVSMSTEGSAMLSSVDVVAATMSSLQRKRLANSPTGFVGSGSRGADSFRRTCQSGSSSGSSFSASFVAENDSQLSTPDLNKGGKLHRATPYVVAATMTNIRLERTSSSASCKSGTPTSKTSSESYSDEEVYPRSSTSSATTSSLVGLAVAASDVARETPIIAGHFEDERSSVQLGDIHLGSGGGADLPLPTDTFDLDESTIESSGCRDDRSAASVRIDDCVCLPLPVDTFDEDKSSNLANESTTDNSQRTTNNTRLTTSHYDDADSLAEQLAMIQSFDSTGKSSLSLRHPYSTSIYESCDNGDCSNSLDRNGEVSTSGYNPFVSCSSTAPLEQQVNGKEDLELPVDVSPVDDSLLHRPRSSMPRRLETTPPSSRFELASSGTPAGVRCNLAASSLLQQPSWIDEQSGGDVASPALMDTCCQTSFVADRPKEMSCQTSFLSPKDEAEARERSCQTSFQVPAPAEEKSNGISCQTSLHQELVSVSTPLPSATSESTLDSWIGGAQRLEVTSATPAASVAASPRGAFKMPSGRAVKSPASGRLNARAITTPSPSRGLQVPKSGRYNNIVSPVGQYINDNPTPPLITNIKNATGRSKLPVSNDKRNKIQPRPWCSPSVLTPSASPNFVRPPPPPSPTFGNRKVASATAARGSRTRNCKENVAVGSGMPPPPSRIATPKSNASRDTLSDSGLLLERSILDTYGISKDELDKIDNIKLRRDVIAHVRKELTRKEKNAIEQAKFGARQSDAPALPYVVYQEPSALASVQKEWDLVTKLHTFTNSKLPVPSPRPIVMKHTGDRKKLQWSNTLMANSPEVFSSPSRPIRTAPPTILIKLPDGVHQGGVASGNSAAGEVDVSMVEVHPCASAYTRIKTNKTLQH